MPRALQIPIEVTGLERAQSNLRQFTESVRRVGATADRVEGQVQRALTVSGPAQRLQRANAALESAQASGDAARIFDAQAAISRATIGMQRARRQQALAGGGGFMDRLTGVLASTRLNAGPVSPLIGRAAELAGIPLTGTTGLMLGGSMAAIGAFTLAIRQATDTLNQFGETMRLTGGTAGETAQMRRFGLGAGEAAGFRQRISTDPMAMMFAARIGVRALPRPFGQVDEAGLIVRAARGLEQMTNAEERLRAERELGLESVERYIQASPDVRRILDEQAAFEERLGAGASAANDLSLATEALTRSWNALLAVVATPAIAGLADDLTRFAALFHGDYRTFFAGDFGIPLDSNKDALDKNTDALNSNSDVMKGAFLQPGQYGGGPRSAAAIPSGWSGDFLARQMESGALGRGARIF